MKENQLIEIGGHNFKTMRPTNFCVGCYFFDRLAEQKCLAPYLDCKGVIYVKLPTNTTDYCERYNWDEGDEYNNVKLFPALLVIAPMALVAGILILLFFPIFKLVKIFKKQ